jgi:hypothetical protein
MISHHGEHGAYRAEDFRPENVFSVNSVFSVVNRDPQSEIPIHNFYVRPNRHL